MKYFNFRSKVQLDHSVHPNWKFGSRDGAAHDLVLIFTPHARQWQHQSWVFSVQLWLPVGYNSGQVLCSHPVHRTLLSSVNFWVRKCVKSAAVLLRRRQRFPSPSGPLSRANFKSFLKNLHTIVHNDDIAWRFGKRRRGGACLRLPRVV